MAATLPSSPFVVFLAAGLLLAAIFASAVLALWVFRLRRRIQGMEGRLDAAEASVGERAHLQNLRLDYLLEQVQTLDAQLRTEHLADLVQLGQRGGQLSPAAADELLAYLRSLGREAAQDSASVEDSSSSPGRA